MSRRKAFFITLGVVVLECLTFVACSCMESRRIAPHTSVSISPSVPKGALELPPEEVARRVQIQIKVTDIR